MCACSNSSALYKRKKKIPKMPHRIRSTTKFSWRERWVYFPRKIDWLYNESGDGHGYGHRTIYDLLVSLGELPFETMAEQVNLIYDSFIISCCVKFHWNFSLSNWNEVISRKREKWNKTRWLKLNMIDNRTKIKSDFNSG